MSEGPATPEGSGQRPGLPTRLALRVRYGERLRWLVLVTLMLGTISSIVSSTIINVAIPDLSRHFVLGQERAQWVAASFMIAMTLSMLLTPWLLNRYGLRRTFLGASLLLGAGGLFGGFSPTYGVMIAMRVAEGVAAGIMQPLPNILILRVFEEREQGKAISMFGFGVVLAPALGPSLGGFLVEAFGWRSIFFVVVPLTLIGVLMARRFMAVDSIMMGERQPLDWRGLGLAGIATVSLLNGVVEMRDSVPAGLALSGFGVLMLAAFVLWQLRAAHPLMNLRLYSYRQFAAGAVVAFIYGAGLFGSTYLLPVYMQMALEYTPSRAGLVLFPAGVMLALTIAISGRFTHKIAPHIQVSFGLALLSLSFLLMALGSRSTPYLVLVALAVLGRIGLGCILPSLTLGAMRGVDFTLIAQGSSCINFLRQLGGAIGVSLAGVGLQWRLAEHGAVLGQAGDAAVQAARIRAFDETFLAVGVVIASAMIAAWRIRPRPVPAA
ncbi:putative arabinose efflux permease AraJ, MFS family [Cupriavidus necator]|uniref:DHA2 family efflux MFS transporter permease subunit n=1 Tax=Cupriavidus necator (strain ATCC 17699 / DSM 428 / KCTC 22496 / NCIMB 10442 / H16 / Stanier 337) TaxID=381666 RepID=Q0K9V2_CUPNH|nr:MULTISPECIES: DHA2 family efflux MFS transporter permease subunit [Cupriavidus]EON20286.1 major facilitator superfamily transporter DHA2 family protein [Cupriavidus sp. GA3-3]KUE87092.1 MFS transporter [Cupriavidus necator]QCC01036.1 DHA2 family efflux MFS transporter permease subunit [Cupriavidus necator H16]QQB76137.1 DHA2 family efflux MFS transporter permease subunit [Cupriavidus necator]WKA39410.1 DHA2 family efflux MFS transporter permease subunit [Cupriavidus necator]